MHKGKFGFILATIFLIITLISIQTVRAEKPMNIIKQGTNKVISILKSPQYKGAEHAKIRREQIWDIISKYFDFPEMARRSLGRYWRKITPSQRKEFVDLFSYLLQRTYVIKIDKYTDEKVKYNKETLDGKYASVETTIVSDNDVETPVIYRLEKKHDTWMVYDVVIEGVSLVNNYRTQFNNVIVTKSYKTLIQKLRQKKNNDVSSKKS